MAAVLRWSAVAPGLNMATHDSCTPKGDVEAQRVAKVLCGRQPCRHCLECEGR